jgi:putative SOS response-associated peptidase YedK
VQCKPDPKLALQGEINSSGAVKLTVGLYIRSAYWSPKALDLFASLLSRVLVFLIAEWATFARATILHPSLVIREKSQDSGFFKWRAIRGARATQPYAVAMKDGSPFGLAGLWENWKNPGRTGRWERTFAIITVPSNDLVGQIHNRMPAILEPKSYERWLGPETDPHDLLITYPSEPMTMWPISTRVN